MISKYYIYCDGYDLDATADVLSKRIQEFIAPYGNHVLFVNNKENGSGSTDLPIWDLGVNYSQLRLTIDEQKDLLLFFHLLAVEMDRCFAVGVVHESGHTEDLAYISPGAEFEQTLRGVLNMTDEGSV